MRRAAAKLLSAIIVSRPDKLGELFPEVAPVLIARFKEREENVKMDVFATFNDLLQQVAQVAACFAPTPRFPCCTRGEHADFSTGTQ